MLIGWYPPILGFEVSSSTTLQDILLVNKPQALTWLLLSL